MKKLSLFIFIITLSATVSTTLSAQWVFNQPDEFHTTNSTMRVGIGVTNPNNFYKLTVDGGSIDPKSGIYSRTYGSGIAVYGRANTGRGVYGLTSSGTGVYGYSTSGGTGVYGRSSSSKGVYGYTSSGDAIYGYATSSSGNAGYFRGKVKVEGNLYGFTSNKTFTLGYANQGAGGPGLTFYGGAYSGQYHEPGETVIVTGGSSNAIGGFKIKHYNGNNWTDQFYVKSDGRVGVGTNNTPTSIGGNSISEYKLFVKGGILTEEVRVRNGWADYVFYEDYALMSLTEVEQHIEEKGHLPNVPSATEVEEEGIQLGEMTKVQQEKIEELFLHVIELDKQMKTVQAENEKLQLKIEELEKQSND